MPFSVSVLTAVDTIGSLQPSFRSRGSTDALFGSQDLPLPPLPLAAGPMPERSIFHASCSPERSLRTLTPQSGPQPVRVAGTQGLGLCRTHHLCGAQTLLRFMPRVRLAAAAIFLLQNKCTQRLGERGFQALGIKGTFWSFPALNASSGALGPSPCILHTFCSNGSRSGEGPEAYFLAESKPRGAVAHARGRQVGPCCSGGQSSLSVPGGVPQGGEPRGSPARSGPALRNGRRGTLCPHRAESVLLSHRPQPAAACTRGCRFARVSPAEIGSLPLYTFRWAQREQTQRTEQPPVLA